MTLIASEDIEHLNREYSPSSCIDDINVYIQQYIDLSAEAKTKAIGQHSIYQDVQYGDNENQCLDIYLPTQNNQQKLMVYIHGGYWQELSKEESSFAAPNFQQQGFCFAVVDYTLAPNATLTEIVEENRQAIAWLYENAAQFGYQPEEIYISGSSAGGHLAMMMLQTVWSKYIKDYQGNVVKGLCAVSGIYDLQPLLQTYVNEPLKMDINEAKTNSPALLDVPAAVPVIIAYGQNETTAFKQQSLMMAEKLRTKGFDVQVKEIEGRNHFDVIVDLSDKRSWLSQETVKLMSKST